MNGLRRKDSDPSRGLRIGLLSNERLARGINWTLLSDSLYSELEHVAGCRRLAPPQPAVRTLGEMASLMRAARDCDVLFGMNVQVRPKTPLALLSLASRGKAKRAMFYADPWKFALDRIRLVDRLMGHDLVFIPYIEPFRELRDGPGGERYRYLPFAADTTVFRDRGLVRDIDIMWLGRREEPLHAAILDYAARRGLNYQYRETMGFIWEPEKLGEAVSRARYFVVTPPPPERSGGYSPLVMRYLEGLAAGCRLVGTRPASGEFEALLPAMSLLEVKADGSDIAELLDRDETDAPAWATTAQASLAVRRDHGWDARARQIVAEIQKLEGV